MAEVRKGVISFTQSGVLHVHEPNGIGVLKGVVERIASRSRINGSVSIALR